MSAESSRLDQPSTRPRTLLQRLADRMATRLLRLPPESSDYSVTSNLRMRMRDGVDLLADMYTPATVAKGTLLVRSPYGWPLPIAAMTGGVYASRGYRVVLARCRGTFGSGGIFEPMVREVEDGADTVAWMRNQTWFDGRFATFGGSYLGFTQWALLIDPPPELVTAVISIGPHDFHDAVYQGGAFKLKDFLGWSDQMAHQEDPIAQRLLSFVTAGRRCATASKQLPLADAGERMLAGRSLWYRNWVSRRDPCDAMWSSMKLTAALDKVNVPVLLQTGWQDLFLEQTLQEHARLAERGVGVALTVGPWTHGELVTKGGHLIVCETLDWFDEYLAKGAAGARASPIRVSVTGAAQQWRDLATWPPRAQPLSLYLQIDGSLGDQPAVAGSSAAFSYDPSDPTPTIGGRILLGGGYVDDTELSERGDVLSFTGSPLPAELEMLGNPVVELGHSTDNPHVDLFVRLSEVDRAGRSHNVSDGFLRLAPTEANGTIRLCLDSTAHRFAVGSRIRMTVAGGSHPRWERNLGTADDPATSTRLLPSRRTIDLAASRLLVPVGSV